MVTGRTGGPPGMQFVASKASIDERLSQVPLFAACTKKELRQIGQLMTPVAVPAGKQLATEGTLGSEFMIIVEGTATVTKRGETVANLGPGDWFGEIALLDDRQTRSATVVADSDMVVEVVDASSFGTLIEEHPTIARGLLKGLAGIVADS